MQYKSLMGIWPDSLLLSESLVCETNWMLQSRNQEEYKTVKQKATDFNILKVVSQTQSTLARIVSSWVSGWPTFDPSD